MNTKRIRTLAFGTLIAAALVTGQAKVLASGWYSFLEDNYCNYVDYNPNEDEILVSCLGPDGGPDCTGLCGDDPEGACDDYCHMTYGFDSYCEINWCDGSTYCGFDFSCGF